MSPRTRLERMELAATSRVRTPGEGWTPRQRRELAELVAAMEGRAPNPPWLAERTARRTPAEVAFDDALAAELEAVERDREAIRRNGRPGV